MGSEQLEAEGAESPSLLHRMGLSGEEDRDTDSALEWLRQDAATHQDVEDEPQAPAAAGGTDGSTESQPPKARQKDGAEEALQQSEHPQSEAQQRRPPVSELSTKGAERVDELIMDSPEVTSGRASLNTSLDEDPAPQIASQSLAESGGYEDEFEEAEGSHMPAGQSFDQEPSGSHDTSDDDDDLLGPLPSSKPGSTAQGSRPVTGFIEAEIQELLAARQHRQLIQSLNQNAPEPQQRQPKRMKMPVVRSTKLEQERARLEREVQVARKQLHKLEHSLEQQRVSVKKDVVAVSPERTTLPQISPFNRAHASGSKMKPTSEGKFEHKVGRVQRVEGRVEQTVGAEQSLGDTDSTALTGLVTSEDAESLDVIGRSADSSALDMSQLVEENSIKEDDTSEIRGSLTILNELKLSVFNKHWMMSKSLDHLGESLSAEEKYVSDAIASADVELNSRKQKKEKELKRLAEQDRKRAMKANRRQDVQDRLKRWAIEQCEQEHRKLMNAEEKARSAADAYHTLNEKLKWKDELTGDEQSNLGRLRMDKRVAAIQLEKETAEYDNHLQRTFVEAWKNEQEKVRIQGSSLSKEQIYLEGALKMPTLFAMSDEDPHLKSRMITNRIRAAALRHAQESGKDGIIFLYQWHIKFENLDSKLQDGGFAFDLLDGTCYSGQWNENGKPDGVGVERYPEGFVYAGQVKNDLRHGLGSFFDLNAGVIYEGMWWNGNRHGFGVESHQLPKYFDPVPVAFAQYEHGDRRSNKRFQGDKDIEIFLLQRVRQITAQAKGASDRCFELQSVGRMPSSYSETSQSAAGSTRPNSGGPSEDKSREQSDSTPTRAFGTTDSQELLKIKVQESKKVLKEKALLRQKKELQQLQKQQKTFDLSAQKSDLQGIDASVSSAFQKLSESTGKGFEQVNHLINKVGLNSGRLYSMTPGEVSASTPEVKPLEKADLARFLHKEKVPEALGDRIVEMYFDTFGKEVQVVDNRRVIQERKLLLKLCKNSDWHVIDPVKQTITIRKRFKKDNQVVLPADLAANDLRGIIFASANNGAPAPKKKKKRLPRVPSNDNAGSVDAVPAAEEESNEKAGNESSIDVSTLASPLAALGGVARAASTIRANVAGMRDRASSGAGATLGSVSGLEQVMARENIAASRRNSIISIMSDKILGDAFLKSPGRGNDAKALQDKDGEKGKGAATLFQEDKPVVITVPLEMTIEQAVANFDKEKYSYILVRPGTFRMNQCVEINKEIHIQGEDGARLQGTWFFKAGHSKCTIKNVTLIHEAEPDIQTEGYQRMIHIVMGELVVSDCAILCPGGYPLWAANRAAVTVSDCIVAGAEDCTSKMASGVVAMEFSRLFIRNTRIESAEECCVFVDNDAEVKLKKCCLQSGDVGVMLTDRSSVQMASCVLRLFRRGIFGEMRKGDAELIIRDSMLYGPMFVGECQPSRLFKSGNKYMEALLDYSTK